MAKEINWKKMYSMLSESLKAREITDEGVLKFLDCIKDNLDADDVIMYKFNNDSDGYEKSYILSGSNSDDVDWLVNYIKQYIEDGKVRKYHFSVDYARNVILMPAILEKSKYLVAFNFKSDVIAADYDQLSDIQNSIEAVLGRLEILEELSENSTVDRLTDLNNRNAYEYMAEKYDQRSNAVYGIFDLFRLKYVNDNYGHDFGDRYIVKTAEILKKYFPKYRYSKDNNGVMRRISTGLCLYRIGGDEFVLVSTSESKELIKDKLDMACEEVKDIDLGINDTLGLNYGLSTSTGDKTIKEMYVEADKELSANKRETYKSLGLDRRR